MTRIAIIGAGLSGLVAARNLSTDCSVSVFEKSRGVGGRMATRRADDLVFDHGTQFFTAKSATFRRFLEPMITSGIVKPWNARFVEIDAAGITSSREWDAEYPHFVACPNMNALGKRLAEGLDVHLGAAVARLEKRGNRWQILDAASHVLGDFDWVVVTAPAPQADHILPDVSGLSAHAGAVSMLPCFALMLGFDEAPRTGWDAALVKDSPVSWISVNSSKPGRERKPCWVVHSSNAWAARHLEDDPEAIKATLCDAAAHASGHDVLAATHCSVHRWRYANAGRQPRGAQVDASNRLAACGDWFVRGRVEGAFLSARRMIGQMRQAI